MHDSSLIWRLQAWEAFCRRSHECGRHPQPPTKAYLISLPVDAPKREYSLQLLRDLGLDVEVIDGIKSVQVRRRHPCTPSRRGRMGTAEQRRALFGACSLM